MQKSAGTGDVFYAPSLFRFCKQSQNRSLCNTKSAAPRGELLLFVDQGVVDGAGSRGRWLGLWWSLRSAETFTFAMRTGLPAFLKVASVEPEVDCVADMSFSR